MSNEASHGVALLLIGSELLTGKVRDTNGAVAVQALGEVGARLVEIRVVHDEPPTIEAAVREMRTAARWLVTSGGIGPTHDDLTLPAVAAALDRPLVRHPELQAHVERVFGADPGKVKVWSRMALVPEGCTLVEQPDLFWPVYQVENVFVLPGVPQLFARQFEVIRPLFAGTPVYTSVVYVTVGEGAIAEPLTDATLRFPALTFGSYPIWGHADFRTRLTVEGTDPAGVRDAAAWLAAAVGEGVVHEIAHGQKELKY